MPTCPIGHDSADDEFCDVCGRSMDGPAPDVGEPAASASGSDPGPALDLPPAGAECQVCGTPLAGRFCEACGHDSMVDPPPSAEPPQPVAPPAPVAQSAPVEPAAPVDPADPTNSTPSTAWTATVRADRAYYDSMMAAGGPDAAAITFPQFCPDRTFQLRTEQVSIGRQSRNRGINPDIDLTGPPEDPGVSHLHAVLVAQPDGTWSVVDLDSSNGTAVNDDPNPITPNTPHQLADGDRIYLGAWTSITLTAS